MRKVCTVLREEELGAILEKLRVIREFQDQAAEDCFPCSDEAWNMIESCKDLLNCLQIIDDDKRREVISESHGRKHDD